MSRAILMAGGGTGGHVFPMVAVADALHQLAPEVRLVFVGTERGLEAKVVPERGYELELMDVAPIRGGGFSGVVRGIARAAGSLPRARALVRRIGPGAVFSIGGYAAGPISLAARVSGVPLALMEPNAVIGLSNRLIAPLVQRAYTAFAESERHFRSGAVLRSGVPIRGGFEPRAYARASGPLRVLVLGGSQGARALNETVPEALCRARTEVRVIHQSGQAHEPAVVERYRTLGAEAWATVVPFIEQMPEALAAADLVVSRSGASAVSEICAVGRPSILVPYPFAAGDHQRRNAESLQQAGAAVCVASAEASSERLAAEIDELMTGSGRLEQMAALARELGRPQAAETIARDLLRLAGLRVAPAPASAAVVGAEPPPNSPVALQETG
jgi:UDP-N-acetylglucosamine--N-acetylmuramyl-(pentapeptide) pyrophosphoryl-undecaprenol N-acetylglucosamine transferase